MLKTVRGKANKILTGDGRRKPGKREVDDLNETIDNIRDSI